MWPLRKIGPPRGMEPDEAFAYALFALVGYLLWQLFFPFFGTALR